ncbi:MAG TPA: hypothetical protein VF461_17745 [Gemmatimonadaceae bacterium]
MDQQEQAFLSAAFGVGDERLQRRLLVGFHLIRDCCRIVDDPDWVPRVRVAKNALEHALANGTFAPDDLELAALRGLLGALDSDKPHRAAVCSALVAYGEALYRENSLPATLAAFDVLDQLWTPACQPRDRLEAAYYQGMTLVRGRYAREASSYMPLLLALRARAAGDVEYIALAGIVHLSRTMYSGNIALGLREAEKRLRQLQHHPSLRAEGNFLHNIAAAHGRVGRTHETLRIADGLLDGRYHPSATFGALDLIGVAFVVLGDLDAARAAFEMMLLAPYSGLRRHAALGLMNIHARRMERREFEQIHRYLDSQPLEIDIRIDFFLTAGRGWEKLGDLSRARAAFDEAYQLARECGLGYEIFKTEELIGSLSDPPPLSRPAEIAPDVAAHVSAMRDQHANEIAACLA